MILRKYQYRNMGEWEVRQWWIAIRKLENNNQPCYLIPCTLAQMCVVGVCERERQREREKHFEFTSFISSAIGQCNNDQEEALFNMVKCAGLGCYPLRLKWITPRVVCRILHILHILSYYLYPKAKFDNCFIIHSQYFPVLKGVLPFLSLFFYSPKITQPHPQVFLVNGSITCRQWAALLTSLVQYDSSFQIGSTAAGYDELCMQFQPIRDREMH